MFAGDQPSIDAEQSGRRGDQQDSVRAGRSHAGKGRGIKAPAKFDKASFLADAGSPAPVRSTRRTAWKDITPAEVTHF